MNEKRTIDNTTLRKGLLSMVVSLVDAESISMRLPREKAKESVAEFIKTEVLKDLLGQDPAAGVNRVKAILLEVVNGAIERSGENPATARAELYLLKEILE